MPPPAPTNRAEARFDFFVERWPVATYALVGTLVAIHVAIGMAGPPRVVWWFRLFGPRAEAPMLRWGARGGVAVADGELWRLVTHGFLHWDMVHLLVNALALFGLGRLAETVFGPVRLYVLFLVSVIGGGLLSQTAGPSVVSAGASGGLFGVLGALVTFGVARRATMGPSLADLFVRRLWPWLVLNLAAGLLLPYAYRAVTAQIALAYTYLLPTLRALVDGLPARLLFGDGPSLDNRAHLGGLVAGSVCALLLGERITDNHARRPAATVAMAIALTVTLTWAAGMLALRR
ncbi:MAG: rhomboid family intramembrane serine protease [Myxococcota bacterium]